MTLTTACGFEKLKTYAHESAELLKVLGNANRLQLLCQIAAGERSVGQLEEELDIRQPALSQQLAELRKAGIVRSRRESRSIFYSLDDARILAILEVLRALYCDGTAPAAVADASLKTTVVPTGDTARFAKLGR